MGGYIAPQGEQSTHTEVVGLTNLINLATTPANSFVVKTGSNTFANYTLVAGSNITLTPSGTSITIASTGGGSGGSGTVTSVSVTTANGISGSVATATSTPAITLTLGAITPTSIGSATTATTQAAGDNSTLLATTAFTTTAINNAIAGVNPAVAVEVASAAKLPNTPTYNNGVSGVGAFITTVTTNTSLVVDGYTVALNDRVLVKNEGDSGGLGALANGVYKMTTASALGVAWILTRALDYNSPSDINETGAIPVKNNGTVNPLTSWLLTSTVTTVGTDALTYTQFSYSPTAIIPLNLGGTAAALVASNGGILYSGASAFAVLAGTATANKILYSGATAAPNWSVPTFPVTASATSLKHIRSDGTNWIASTVTYPDAAVTAGKVMISDGTNYIASTPTFPNASATSGKVIKSDGTNWVASTETYPAPSTSGNIMTSDGTNWTSAAAAGGGAWTFVSGGTFSVSVGTSLTTLKDITGLAGNSDYVYHLIIFIGETSGANLDIKLQFNSAAGTYSWKMYFNTGNANSTWGQATGTSIASMSLYGDTAGGNNSGIAPAGMIDVLIKAVKETNGNNRRIIQSTASGGSDETTIPLQYRAVGVWSDITNEITSIQIRSLIGSGTQTVTGRYMLYKGQVA